VIKQATWKIVVEQIIKADRSRMARNSRQQNKAMPAHPHGSAVPPLCKNKIGQIST
jgi:hypothetical protein